MHDDLQRDVIRLDRAVFGDRDNPKDFPGLIAEQARMGLEQARTNEILMELKKSVQWIGRLIVGGFVTALLGVVLKVGGS